MTQRMVTANRLIDGAVVFLAADGSWTAAIADGRVADEEGAQALMAIAERAVTDRHVVAPYLIDVVAETGAIRPVRFRERIRASGPSIAYGAAADRGAGGTGEG